MIWLHRSAEDLARAGFRSRGLVPCPLCCVEIEIYQVPGQMPVFLDPATYTPHLATPQHWYPPVDHKTAAAGSDE
jgi:hypothetical protein